MYFQLIDLPRNPTIHVPPLNGVPRGAYGPLPSGIKFYDLSGQYYIMGGNIYAQCFVRQVFSGNMMAYVGPMIFYDYDGDLFEDYGSSTQGSSRGWGWEAGGTESGTGSAWQSAIDRWMNFGMCTKGYEVWVDMEQVCRSDGTRAL